jgi:hypothetical protein
MSYVEYDSNNSGGSWWLDDEDWKKLEAAGWVVEWANLKPQFKNKDYVRRPDGIPELIPGKDAFVTADKDGVPRWLGAIAKRAYKPNCESLREAADEWEQITGKSATDAGCPCCGQPHNFTLYSNTGEHLDSGPHISYEASW